MTDPYRPEGSNQPWQRGGTSEPPTYGQPPYVDPAYAGQLPTYPPGYPPQAPHPTEQLPRLHCEPSQPPPGAPPPGRPGNDGRGGPPEPPRFPNWLFLVAGAAVLLVVGMVIALVIANGSQRNSATVTPVTPLPTAPSTPIPKRVPTTTPSPSRTPAPSTTNASFTAPSRISRRSVRRPSRANPASSSAAACWDWKPPVRSKHWDCRPMSSNLPLC